MYDVIVKFYNFFTIPFISILNCDCTMDQKENLIERIRGLFKKENIIHEQKS